MSVVRAAENVLLTKGWSCSAFFCECFLLRRGPRIDEGWDEARRDTMPVLDPFRRTPTQGRRSRPHGPKNQRQGISSASFKVERTT